MTKSTGVGRGGKRPGAGRKPSGANAQRQKVERAVAVVTAAAKDGEPTTASDLVEEAYATLRDVMANSESDAPRVTAARAVIELAREEGGGASGKKAQQQAKAEGLAQTSRFAPRTGPRLVSSN